MFDEIGPYVASSRRRRYFGPGFSVGLQPLSRSQRGNASMPMPNDLTAVGATAAAEAGPACARPTSSSARTRATRAGRRQEADVTPEGSTPRGATLSRLPTMTADERSSLVLEDSEVERVLVVTAHPDDADFGAAGTISGLTAAGIEVTYCVCTDGDAGGFDPTVDRAEIPGIRRAEQQAAGKAVGVTDVRFLGYKDGALERDPGPAPGHQPGDPAGASAADADPERGAQLGPDRRQPPRPPGLPGSPRSPRSTPTRATRSRTRRCWPTRASTEWAVAETWVMAHPDTNHFVDITDRFATKVEALRAHESQTAHMDDLESRLREWGQLSAEAGGLSPGRLAERFFVVATA